MKFTRKQCELLLNIFNAGVANAIKSGFPIGKEYYNDIDEIKEKLYWGDIEWTGLRGNLLLKSKNLKI